MTKRYLEKHGVKPQSVSWGPRSSPAAGGAIVGSRDGSSLKANNSRS